VALNSTNLFMESWPFRTDNTGKGLGRRQRPLPRLILMSYNFFCYMYVTCNKTFTLQWLHTVH